MRQTVSIPGIEKSLVEIETGWLKGPRLLVDGSEAPRGGKRGSFRLRRDDGSETEVRFKPDWIDPVPKLEVDGQLLQVARPLRWYEWVWIGLPITLLFVGGFIGALAGFIAASASVHVMRSERGALYRFGVSALISIAAVLIYLIAVVLLQLLIPGD